MSYATVSDITSEFRELTVTTTSPITTAEVERFLLEADALIDTKLSNRYTVPIVSGSVSLVLLRKIEIDIVAYRIASILNLKKEVPLPDKTILQDLNYTASYKVSMKLLDDLFSGKILLPDATIKTDSSGFADYNYANDIGPIFERDTKQW